MQGSLAGSRPVAARGFEPQPDGDGLIPRTCPFDTLARSPTALVCGVDLDYVDGTLEVLRCRSLDPRLDPASDRCCVRVLQTGEATTR